MSKGPGAIHLGSHVVSLFGCTRALTDLVLYPAFQKWIT